MSWVGAAMRQIGTISQLLAIPAMKKACALPLPSYFSVT
jgi:hypothetical protein